jgi:hypothetical protein
MASVNTSAMGSISIVSYSIPNSSATRSASLMFSPVLTRLGITSPWRPSVPSASTARWAVVVESMPPESPSTAPSAPASSTVSPMNETMWSWWRSSSASDSRRSSGASSSRTEKPTSVSPLIGGS